MTRTMKFAATAVFGLSLALTTAACGSETESASASDTHGSAVAPTSGAGDSSVPVIAGPKPKTRSTSAEATTESIDNGQKTCGATGGPDGALQIYVVSGDIDCATARSISKEYGPLIASGKAQQVSGWDCGPSSVTGELSRCTKGNQAFGLKH